MQVIINDCLIDVEIKRKNNKNIYFRFNDRKLIVTCSKFISEKDILKLINKNEQALFKMYKKNIKEVENNYYFNYLGKKYIIMYDGITKDVYFENDMVIAKDEKTLFNYYNNECLRVFNLELKRILHYFKNIPNFSLRIRKMKTRWGVNNITKKIITLNSELLKKELHLIDYVIIHELCHFYEANHSEKFWNHVSKYYPKYKEARKELRDV